MQKKHIFLIKWTLFLLFTLYTAGISFFTHSTVIDGVTYVHSHPFRPGERDTHEHCPYQLLLLEQHFNTTITSNVVPDIDLSDYSPVIALFYGDIREMPHLTGVAENSRPRAPPRFANLKI